MEPFITIRLKNQVSELEQLYEALVQFGRIHQIPSAVLEAMNLALEEIITNIISYAYSNTAEHTIILRLSLEGHQFFAEVEDDGRPFNPLDAPPPTLDLPLEDRPIGGLGIFLAKKMMDHVEYLQQDGKNLVRLKKSVTQ